MRIRIYLSFLYALTLFTFVTSASCQVSTGKYEINNKFSRIAPDVSGGMSIAHFTSNFMFVPMSAIHWNTAQWSRFAGVAGITLALYRQDKKINRWTQQNRNQISNSMSRYAEPLGGSLSLAPAGVLYLYGTLSDDVRAIQTALNGIESVITAGFIAASIKEISHRHRPNSGDSFDQWDGPKFSVSDLSFPSGHSAAAFAMATTIASEYQDKPVIKTAAYGIASLTALSRVNDNKHWASDVFLGSVIGYFTAKTLINISTGYSGGKYVLTPVTDGHSVGMSLTMHY